MFAAKRGEIRERGADVLLLRLLLGRPLRLGRRDHEHDDGDGKAQALVFLSDQDHAQWAGDLTLEQQAELIAGARGLSGRNIDYLRDLVVHLREQGVGDPAMERLLAMVEAREPATAGG